MEHLLSLKYIYGCDNNNTKNNNNKQKTKNNYKHKKIG